MKAVLTGATGHIGYNTVLVLLQKGYSVTTLIRRENINSERLKRLGCHVHVCDLSKPDTYSSELENSDVVFHLAAENTTSTADEKRVLQNTVGITESFLTTCCEKKVPVIVYTSSVVVLGRSSDKNTLIGVDHKTSFRESPYVAGKTDAEHFVEKLIAEKKVDIRRIYPSWVVGPNDFRMTPPHKIITGYVRNGQKFWFSGGISLVSVEEVAKTHVSAFEKGEFGGKYLAGGENITFKQFYNLLSKYSGHPKPFIFIPKWVVVAGAYATSPIFRLLGMAPLLTPGYAKSVFGNYSWYDSQKTVEKLGHQIESAEKIIKEAVFDAGRKIVSAQNLGFKMIEQPYENSEKGVLLITGVPGWLGNRMVDIMINGDRDGEFRTERKVRLLVEPRYRGLLDLPSNYEIFYGDLMNPESVKQALEGVDTVFHIAGAIYPKKIETLYKVNTEGTKILVDACIESKIRRIIYMSTDSVCGRGTKKQRIFDANTPPTPYKNYGRSKYLAEKYILDKTHEGLIDGTSLRGFWFFGPFAPERQVTFLNMFNWPRQLVFGNGKNFRSISHVDNIIQAFFKAEKNPATFGKWYWIAGYESEMTVDEIYQTIAEKLRKPYKPLHIPVWMCKMAGIADTVLGKMGILNSTIHAAGKFYFDIAGTISDAENDFGYKPKISFEMAAEELKDLMN